jgi:hypothetical protein
VSLRLHIARSFYLAFADVSPNEDKSNLNQCSLVNNNGVYRLLLLLLLQTVGKLLL